MEREEKKSKHGGGREENDKLRERMQKKANARGHEKGNW